MKIITCHCLKGTIADAFEDITARFIVHQNPSMCKQDVQENVNNVRGAGASVSPESSENPKGGAA